jgi:spoIIIJ-associated protein
MDNLEIIKQAITDLLKKMDFEAVVDIDISDQNNIIVNIQTEQAGFLIGQAGVNLSALQHLVRILVNKKSDQPVQFILDVNDYRKHRLELLKELAKDIAREALSKKVSLILHPMSAYERRIIHLALADEPEINTESTGEEPKRRIVIKPVEAKGQFLK